MQLLCLSNGHGEDLIALRILQALQRHSKQLQLAALPIVGQGEFYRAHGIPIVGAVQAMPSGGFIYMDGRQLARDLQGGLVQLTLAQLKTVRQWAQQGGVVLAVGDIVPLLFAWWSGAAYGFVGTAKSEYYLRDEQGWLPRQSWFERLERWSGSVYLPWDRWLMAHPRCKAVFPRDRLTSTVLQKWGIPAFDLGNPMMDGLEPTGVEWAMAADDPNASEQGCLTFVLLPGSRPPEAYENWQILLQAVSALVMAWGNQRSLLFLAAVAPQLDPVPLQRTLEAYSWRLSGSVGNPSDRSGSQLVFSQYRTSLGDMVKNPQVVYDKAEEMAAKYRERMLQQSQPVAEAAAPVEMPVEEELPSAEEE
ncbi:lipid-A-disaccharide synthase-related protein [Leptolyngbya sp. 7M]|nr:lipid-A-disaccharide synthase-related protein [Leptolyngbya sp. 7M]